MEEPWQEALNDDESSACSCHTPLRAAGGSASTNWEVIGGRDLCSKSTCPLPPPLSELPRPLAGGFTQRRRTSSKKRSKLSSTSTGHSAGQEIQKGWEGEPEPAESGSTQMKKGNTRYIRTAQASVLLILGFILCFSVLIRLKNADARKVDEILDAKGDLILTTVTSTFLEG
jgi:hypothetical protein